MEVIEERRFTTLEMAVCFFDSAVERLLNINGWKKYAGFSAYQLMDCKGNKLERLARVGDYIRIDIPGPDTNSGKGYDWVYIEEITDEIGNNARYVGIRVRPKAHPFSGTGNDLNLYYSQQ